MASIELIPIAETIQENEQFLQHPDCEPGLSMSVEYFQKIGYNPPWIGYWAQREGKLVGSAGFKGKPKEGNVEIAYGTFPFFQKQGIGSEICRKLVLIALKTDPAVRITARTFSPDNYSSRILQKNGFLCLGTVWDEEDGNVWEWEFQGEVKGNL